MENIRIRKLDASETSRRRKEVGKARSSLKTLLNLDKEALKDIDQNLLKKLQNMIGGVSGESD
jgi:galactokinase